jgi:hypothetical protein
MSIDTIVQAVIAVSGTILVPGVGYLYKAISSLYKAIDRNTEEVIELKACLKSGVEPRLNKCEGDIDTLYARSNEHGEAIAALKAKQRP